MANVTSSQTSSQSVLLVEDDPTNREVAHQYLVRGGHVVVAVNTGEAALSYLDSKLPDLVLLDVSLPGISGLDVLAKIRSSTDPRVHSLAVIAMSAHVFEEEVEQYLAAGMNGFLGKPFSPEELERSIARLSDEQHRPFVEGTHVVSGDSVTGWKTSPIIEESIIEQDIQLLGTEKVDRLLDVFVCSGKDYLHQFSLSMDQEDNGNIALIAHKMKSASGNFGFLRLSALLQEIEDNADSGAELVSEVAPLFYASNSAAEALLQTAR